MKRVPNNWLLRQIICVVAVTLFSATGAWAFPTTADQARTVVQNWLGLEALPMSTPLGGQVKEVETFYDTAGEPSYYAIYLDPAGLVLVPADDLVEPIIGFLPEGTYDPSPTNPLGALVNQDIPGRVAKAREIETRAQQTSEAPAPETCPGQGPKQVGPAVELVGQPENGCSPQRVLALDDTLTLDQALPLIQGLAR